MYLQKLVVNGFKSFAESTEFRFTHPFTSVVGPNGSGKTNVADALRWVMGEQSLKLMRMKSSTDAIFAGSRDRGKLGMAQVDLHLNNVDGRLNIDYPEVVISRRLTRKGDTEYLINNNKVRLQDILLLLAQANFGQKSYGVIGQGMITDILNANPQDRKEFFDEATGVKEFQIKRDQAVNKLIRTEQNLLRVEDLLNEIGPRLRSLTRQVQKLERRQSIEKDLRVIQADYYGSILVDIQSQTDQFVIQHQTLEQKRLATQKQLSVIEQEIDTFGKEASRGELFGQLQQSYSVVQDQKNELLKQQAILKGKLEVQHERSGEVELLWLQRRLDEIIRNQDQANIEISGLQESIQHQNTQLDKAVVNQTEVDASLAQLRTQLEKTKEELVQLTNVLSMPEIKRQLQDLFQKQEQFLREIMQTTSLDQFKAVQTQAKDITSQLADLLDKLHEERDDELAIKQSEIKSIDIRIQETTQLKEKLLNDVVELRGSTHTRKEKISLLQESIDGWKKEQSQLEADISQAEKNSKETVDQSTELKALQIKATALEHDLQALDGQLNDKKSSLDTFHDQEEQKKQRLLELQVDARRIQTELNQLTNQIQTLEIELAKLHTRADDVHEEIRREVDTSTEEAISKITKSRTDQEKLLNEIERLKHQLELIGGIDPEIVEEHDSTKERHDFLKTQSKDLRDTINSLERVIDDLDTTIKRQFNKAFRSIAKSFSTYFETLFDGGEAKLEMMTEEPSEEEDDELLEGDAATEFSAEDVATLKHVTGHMPIGKLKKKQRIVSGIEIIAQPPGKKLQSVHALSGGEKSMTAIALICAIIDANCPPFVVLDEVEAALDESNSEKFSSIIRHLSSKSQFVIITHNRATMSKADILYGVTMAKDGTSHILSVKMAEAEKMLEAKQ